MKNSRITELRKEHKHSQSTLSEMLGVSDIKKPETSNISPEKARILKRLATSDDAMVAEVSQFMDYVDFKKGNMDESTAKLLAEKK